MKNPICFRAGRVIRKNRLTKPNLNFDLFQEFNATGGDPNSSIFAQIVEFAKNLPLFPDLNMETQITLIKSGWNELMILGSAYRSMSLNEDGILMGQGKIITMEDAHRAGLGDIFDRVLVELVGKMEEMKMVNLVSIISVDLSLVSILKRLVTNVYFALVEI